MDDISSRLNDLFSSPEGMEKIKNLVGMLSQNGGAGDASGGTETGGQAPPEEDSSGDFSIDPATIATIGRAFSAMKRGDPRIDLLLALKPNLSDGRRKRVDEAIQIMRLINIMPLLREQGFLHFE